MPQRRRSKKSTVIQLPRGERSHPVSKVVVASRSAPIWEDYKLPSQTNSNSTTALTSSTPPSETRIPSLPYDIWRKIIWHARSDLSTIFNCMNVSVEVERAAFEVLSCIKSVDLSRIFRRRVIPQKDKIDANTEPGSCYVPTEREVGCAVQKLPNLEEVCITRWPYIGPFPHVAHVLMSTFVSTTLQSAIFSHIPIPANELPVWLRSCPNLNSLRLASHPTVNDDLCAKLANSHRNSTLPLRHLRLLALNDSREISDKGVEAVLRAGLCSQFVGTSLLSLRRISLTSMARPFADVNVSTGTSVLHLNACPALCVVIFKDTKAVPQELILSQCSSLTKLEFPGTLLQNRPLALERLVVTGCSRLADLSIPTAAALHMPFGNLKELNLFGARRLNSRNVQMIFGLDHPDGPSLPNLEALNINGTSIETVVLQSYLKLAKVDISGSCVRELTISQCWALRKLIILGKKMPLANVSIFVSSKCEVIGARQEWHRELCGDGPSSFLRFEHVSG